MANIKGIKRTSTGEVYNFSNTELSNTVSQCREYSEQAKDSALTVLSTRNIVGADDIPVFSPYEKYKQYDLVLHRRDDVEEYFLYEAIAPNGPGEWSDSYWRQTSFYDYIRSESSAELVKVRLIYKDNTPITNAKVSYYIDGVLKGSPTTDSQGYISFTAPFGSTYTVVPPQVTGYIFQRPKTYTANSSYRNIKIIYSQVSTDYQVITQDGTIQDLRSFDINQKDSVEFLVLNYSDGDGNGRQLIINIRGKHLVDGAFKKTSWSNPANLVLNYDNTNYPFTTSNNNIAFNDYDGIENTQAMINCIDYYSSSLSLTVPPARFCQELEVQLTGGNIYKGYLPAAGELLLLVNNRITINNYISLLGGVELADMTHIKWSSTQCNDGSAWAQINATNVSYIKSNTINVFPLFYLQ